MEELEAEHWDRSAARPSPVAAVKLFAATKRLFVLRQVRGRPQEAESKVELEPVLHPE